MRIATWNIERLKNKSKLPLIIAEIEQVNADILVLTETDARIKLMYDFSFSTVQPNDMNNYHPTETRVTIYTKYEIVKYYDTFDKHTAICAELKTEIGDLIVYGTIIGIYGNRHKNFMQDLFYQVNDIKCLAKNNNLCIIGDFNCSFTDNYYFTKKGRAALEDMFLNSGIKLITRTQPECVDHIAISNRIIANLTTEVKEWNLEKKLSDHKGIAVDLI